jgi:Outer membrane protein beta-barrel domain
MPLNVKIMKNSKKIINCVACVILTALSLCPNRLLAQKGELSVSAGGAAATLNYDFAGDADVKDGVGFNLGLDYAYYFSDNIGFAIGAEYQQMGAKLNAQRLSGAYDAIDYEQEPFEFRYNMASITEKQKVGFVNIPLTLVYRNTDNTFYIRAGAKVGIPVTNKFTGNYTLSTSGYYEQYNAELFDPLFMAFGNFGRVSANGTSIDLKPSYIATLELGITEPISSHNFYVGFYVDYGLNNIAGNKTHPVVYEVQQSGAGFKYNSILNSGYVDDVKTLSFGVKLRYAFMSF